MKQYKVKDIKLADSGKKKIDWARDHMPVVSEITKEFSKRKPFKGLTIGASLHVTKDTAVLMYALRTGGAKVILCGCNPLSTQDDVAAALAKDDFPIFAWRGQTRFEYYTSIDFVLDHKPQITIDDGCDLVGVVHSRRKNLIPNILGGCEETAMGVNRLRVMEKEGVLKYPMIAVNDAYTKHLFDNRYGTGQSSLDGILRATNILFSGKTMVVVGYGWCGRGVTTRAKGLGSQVIVCEIDPIRALEAVMDGFGVMPISAAVRIGDIFVTVTSNKNVITYAHMLTMKDGAVLANAGHTNVEIDVETLDKRVKKRVEIRPNTVEYFLPNGKTIYVLGEGRIINLVAAEGHPSEVMDMSFATQALSAEYIAVHHKKLLPKVYNTTIEQDRRIATLKLKTMGISIDTMTAAQKKYMGSWTEGT
ncbi:adenosylhomocysteinase [Candidatus Gottesmanbacteria bacterium]|nr:adenosylhomocysteinase [Candidatus Gottesmanbacteria bacterium]